MLGDDFLIVTENNRWKCEDCAVDHDYDSDPVNFRTKYGICDLCGTVIEAGRILDERSNQ